MIATNHPRLLVFSDDWGRHPSSCQHLIGQLLASYRVTWVNTIGMRPPSLNRETWTRGLEKLRHWATGPERSADALPQNLQVVNPRMWPWFRRPRDRRWNQRLLLRGLTPLVSPQSQPVVAVTTIPIVADLVGRLPVQRWIYYCVDDFSVWPGLDQRAMRQMEAELVQKVDSIVAVSEPLRQKLLDAGRTSQLLTHGVDLRFWQAGDGPDCDLSAYPRPLVVFWGVVDRRMDVGLVERLARDLRQGTVLLVGPQQDYDPQLAQLPRTVLLGPLGYEQLPALGRAADVLVMPYQDLPVTRAMQPLKLKEYLATGKPVVVRQLPSTEAWSDCLDQVSSAEQFSQVVCQRLQQGLPESQRVARGRLCEESWPAKARRFEQLLLAGDAGQALEAGGTAQ